MKQRRQRARERDWAPWNRLNGISLDPLNSFLDFLTSFIFFLFPAPLPGSVSHGVERIVVISFSVRFARLLKRKVPKNCVIFFRKRQTNTIESFPNLSFTMTFMNGAKTKIKIFRIVLVRLPWMDKIMSGKWKKKSNDCCLAPKGLGNVGSRRSACVPSAWNGREAEIFMERFSQEVKQTRVVGYHGIFSCNKSN